MHRLTVASAALGLLLASATPAHAQGFWRWLEALSGPGPFKDVVGLEFSPVCFGENQEWNGLFCAQDLQREPKLSIVFDVAWGSGANELGYAAGDAPRGVPDTGLFLFSAGPMWHLEGGAVDVGAVVGMMRLSSLPVVGSLVKPTFEPRLAVRPLVWGRPDDRRMRFLELRYSPIVVFGGFSLADFGAIGGDLTGEPETIHSFQIVINAAALIGR